MKNILMAMCIFTLVFSLCGCYQNEIYTESMHSGFSVPEITSQDFVENVVSGGSGYIAEYDGLLYFSNPDDQNKLYQMDTNFENKVKLSDAANASGSFGIQFYNKQLFYLQSSKSGDNEDVIWTYTLYSYDLVQRTETKLLHQNICSYTINNSWIYFSTMDTKNLYKAKLDGSNTRLLYENGTWLTMCVQVYDNKLYYSCDESLVQVDLSSSEETIYYLYCYSFLIYKGQIFVNDFGNFGKTSINHNEPIYENKEHETQYGSLYERQPLTDNQVTCFTVFQNTIYFATFDDKIYKMDLDGNNLEFIVDGSDPIVLNEYLFYYNTEGKINSLLRK